MDRLEIVTQNFRRTLVSESFFQLPRYQRFSELYLSQADLVKLFESQLISRHFDYTSRIFRKQNATFYTIGSSGHEGNAAVAKAFRHSDMAFLHYRSGAFFVERQRKRLGSTPIFDLALSFVAAKKDPISAGRHKVLGSAIDYMPPQTSTIASHLPKAVGMALSIVKSSKTSMTSFTPVDSVAICSFGDASSNHATAQTAFNAASWCAYQNMALPLVFVCEDNGVGISVATPEGWIAKNFQNRSCLEYLYCDGRDVLDVYAKTRLAAEIARYKRKPVFLHMRTVRILGHAGSDIESTYLTPPQIESNEAQDPLLQTAKIILSENLLSKEEIFNLYDQVENQVHAAMRKTVLLKKQTSSVELMASIVAKKSSKAVKPAVAGSERRTVFGSEYRALEKPHHMAKLINYALVDLLQQYPEALVFGEDVAKKGGVYNVTSGLHKRFGGRRVFNSLLDETTILGAAIGYAQNGFLPIPEIQFLAYAHNAEDQIRGEAATLSFFSNTQCTNPMVVRVAGLGYQKGFGGHFHNDNSFAVFRDIPGLLVACPSNGADAVRMLRTCMDEAYLKGRVCIFLEPIALYMTKDIHEAGDQGWSHVYPSQDEACEIGSFGSHGGSQVAPRLSEKKSSVAILSYANGYYLSCRAFNTLEDGKKERTKIFDLRWLHSTDFAALFSELQAFDKVLVVDECRETGSFSEQILAKLIGFYQCANLSLPVVKRLCAKDCFIPLGDASTIVLPSEKDILQALEELFEQN